MNGTLGVGLGFFVGKVLEKFEHGIVIKHPDHCVALLTRPRLDLICPSVLGEVAIQGALTHRSCVAAPVATGASDRSYGQL